VSPFQADLVGTSHLDAPSARYTYRRLGIAGGVPLVLLTRFRGTIDHWDPALLDVLARERDVILVDYAGVNTSAGSIPATVRGLAGGIAEFIGALGLERADLLGWSLGGYVVQDIALNRAALVRRLIVAASGPGAVPGTPAPPARLWEAARRPVNDDDLLYMFLPRYACRAGGRPGVAAAAGHAPGRIACGHAARQRRGAGRRPGRLGQGRGHLMGAPGRAQHACPCRGRGTRPHDAPVGRLLNGTATARRQDHLLHRQRTRVPLPARRRLRRRGTPLPQLTPARDHAAPHRNGKPMYFLATGSLTDPGQISPRQQEEETRVLTELRQQGLVREAFRRAVGPGVISILQAPSLNEAQAHMGRLPFVALGLLTFEYTELIEL
jgi:pimeloyl-ACP methyl ester carboxylesterase